MRKHLVGQLQERRRAIWRDWRDGLQLSDEICCRKVMINFSSKVGTLKLLQSSNRLARAWSCDQSGLPPASPL